MSQPNPTSKSRQLYDEAAKVIPGGVSRNMVYRKPYPDYAAKGEGCRVTDIDGTTRIDFSNNTASLIHGHAFPAIVKAVSEQLAIGTAFSMATESELRFAQHLCSRNDCFDQVRFMSSGTEAVMAGIKAARAMTGRTKIAKSEGAYHGTYDYAEVSQNASPENWGDPTNPLGVPVAKGTPQSVLDDVVIFPFNNIDRTIGILDRQAGELACVLIDPLPHRAGLIPATNEFINAIRKWTLENGVLLIFDEVISFRMGYGGAQDWYDAEPDLTATGKLIGGGLPVGALAGKADYMSVFDRDSGEKRLPFSGTFSANPITMTAGLAALEAFDNKAVSKINELGDYARKEIKSMIDSSGVEACVTGAGSMFRLYLKPAPPTEYRSAVQDKEEASHINFLVDYLYDEGFLMINTCSAALSTALSKTEIDQLVETLARGLSSLKKQT